MPRKESQRSRRWRRAGADTAFSGTGGVSSFQIDVKLVLSGLDVELERRGLKRSIDVADRLAFLARRRFFRRCLFEAFGLFRVLKIGGRSVNRSGGVEEGIGADDNDFRLAQGDSLD